MVARWARSEVATKEWKKAIGSAHSMVPSMEGQRAEMMDLLTVKYLARQMGLHWVELKANSNAPLLVGPTALMRAQSTEYEFRRIRLTRRHRRE